MSNKIKGKRLKADAIVSIDINAAFYFHMHSASITMLSELKDPKKALENIDAWSKNSDLKLTAVEHGIMVLMNLIHDVETVAMSNPDKYVEEYEEDLNNANTEPEN